MPKEFDISDGRRNRYEPCPKCSASIGMGLSTKNGFVAVSCGWCDHRGPEIQAPPPDQWETWPVPWHERDRQAFEAWNKQSRDARAEKTD